MTGRDPTAWTPRPGGRSRPARDRPRAPQERRAGLGVVSRLVRLAVHPLVLRREEAESARRQRIETSGRERGREEGTRREPTGRTVPATMATSRDPRVARARPHMFRSRASRPGRRSRPRRRGICARRAADVACARRRDVVRAKRGRARERCRALARGDCVSTGVAHLPSSSVASRHCPVRQLPRGVVEPRKTGATHRLAIALDQSPALRLRDERARRLGDRLARPVGGDHARNPIRLRLSTQLRVVLELRVGRFGRARGFRFGQFGLL